LAGAAPPGGCAKSGKQYFEIEADSLNNISAITLLSYKEGLKHRVLYGVVIFALILMTFAVLISGLFLRDISKIILDLCLSAVNVGGLLIPFFLAVHLLARDIEKRTIFTILAQPVSRSSYIVGKYLGIVLLTGTVMAVLSGATFLSVLAGRVVYGTRFFSEFSMQAVLLSIFLSFVGIMVLNAMVVFWCSVTTSAFIATLLTLFTYLIGHTIDDVVRFLAAEINLTGAHVSDTVRYTVELAKYIFPNLSAFDIKLQAAHGLIIPAADAAFLFGYGAAYICAALSLAMLIFGRRDFA